MQCVRASGAYSKTYGTRKRKAKQGINVHQKFDRNLNKESCIFFNF